MALSAIGRKHLLERGKQQEIAGRLRVVPGYVSQVVNGVGLPLTKKGWKQYRRVQIAIARSLNMRLDEAFSPRELGAEEERQSSAA